MRAYERLLKYVTISSPSNPDSSSCPSSKETWNMAEYLKKEMEELGLTDIILDENCYLYATIPATDKNAAPVIGFIAHMDVSCDAPSDNRRRVDLHCSRQRKRDRSGDSHPNRRCDCGWSCADHRSPVVYHLGHRCQRYA